MKEVLIVKRFRLDLTSISSTLYLTPRQVLASFNYGHTLSRLAEEWASSLWSFNLHKNASHKDTDGYYNENTKITVRILNKNTKMQSSRYMGAKRTCNRKNLIDSLSTSAITHIVDIREFPVLTSIGLNTSILSGWESRGDLTTSGLSAKKFWYLVQENFQLKEEWYVWRNNQFILTEELMGEKIKETIVKNPLTEEFKEAFLT